jgi:hypothetical protein
MTTTRSLDLILDPLTGYTLVEGPQHLAPDVRLWLEDSPAPPPTRGRC